MSWPLQPLLQGKHDVICLRLSMINPVVVGCSSYRANITYCVKPQPDKTFCNNMAKELKQLGTAYPKTVIFCRQYKDCAALYHLLCRYLGKHITYPSGYPVLLRFAMVNIYTRACTVNNREEILTRFCNSTGVLRIVIATTAFGMGIDCSDIRTVYHWSPPSTTEEYAQETGRAGRDSHHSKAIMFYSTLGKCVS